MILRNPLLFPKVYWTVSKLYRIFFFFLLATSVIKAKAGNLYILNLWLIIFYMH